MDTNLLSLNNIRKVRRKAKVKKTIYHTFLQIVLILTSLMYLYVFVWMAATALKTQKEFVENSFSIFVQNPQWYNLIKVTQVIPFFRYVGNTFILVIGTMVGTVLSSSLVAFSFAKLRWPGKNVCFMVLMATLMLPATVLQIPTFVLFSKFGWLNTFLPIIVPTFFGGGAFNIFLTREYYRNIPDDLLAAAKIDGCGYFNVWLRIMLPVCIPVSCTVAVLTFMNTWNDFMSPLLYINDVNLYPISLGLRAFQQQYATQWDMMMAGALLSMIPTLVIYFCFQKYFMEGVSISSSIKG